MDRSAALSSSFGIFLVLVALLVTACGGGGSGSSDTQTSGASAVVVTPSSALLMPGQTLQFSASQRGASISPTSWMVNNAVGGSAATGTINSSGLYIAPTTGAPGSVQITAAATSQAAPSAPAQISFFNPTNFKAGTVAGTANPLVALYTFTAPQGATVQVKFGATTQYGLTTWAQPAPIGGGDVGLEVAGMRASSTYHMQAIIHLDGGEIVVDADKEFTTGAISPGVLPDITVQQTAGANPASGVEMLNLYSLDPNNTIQTAVVTDLEGNIIWYYPNLPYAAFPLKPLPNGNMLIGTGGELRETDLAGNTIFALPLAQVQSSLAAIGLTVPTLVNIHHDMLKLPNGHYLFLVNFNKTVAGQPPPGLVLADIIVDWDPQQGPVWVWNAFDHLSLSHAPEGTADWTHANALVYSPDDGNLILSMRNQNWVIKINYADGAGDGSVLWHLGPEGDFALPAGVSPIEWNYGQHYPVFLGPSAGIFPLLLFNNGTVRYVDANNTLCGTPGVPSCYSSVPVFQVNEYDKSVQVLSEINLSPAYSVCCGSVGQLDNGDTEYDIAADVSTPNTSTIQEVTPAQTPELVWQMTVKGILAYRGFRIPSLYPGVVWTRPALAMAYGAAKPAALRKLPTSTTDGRSTGASSMSRANQK